MLIDQINTHCPTQATAGDWAAVAAVIRMLSTTAEPRECGAVETIDALIAVGVDPSPLQVALESTPNGRFLLNKLANIGVAWAHRLTQPVLAALVMTETLPQRGMDALVQLSAPVTFLFPDASEADCKAAWAAEQHRQRCDAWRSRFDAALNTIGTAEQASGVKDLRAMAAEMEAT